MRSVSVGSVGFFQHFTVIFSPARILVHLLPHLSFSPALARLSLSFRLPGILKRLIPHSFLPSPRYGLKLTRSVSTIGHLKDRVKVRVAMNRRVDLLRNPHSAESRL